MAAERVVIDASAAVRAAIVDGFAALTIFVLVAPTLLWSESASAIRQLEYRRELSEAEATEAMGRLVSVDFEVHLSRDLATDAHQLARELGWAKTYDAEFIALARRLGIPLLTVDARLARTASRFVTIVN